MKKSELRQIIREELLKKNSLNERDAYADGKKYFTRAFGESTPSTIIAIMESVLQNLLEDDKIEKSYVKGIIKSMEAAAKRLSRFV
jgi:hypothetical protein